MFDVLESLCGLLQIPSVTGQPSVTDEGGVVLPYGQATYDALCYTLNLCEKLGFRVKNCDNYMGYAEIGQGDTLVGILAHLDVVPAGEDWDFPPFDGTIQDGILYGRGTLDDKGPVVAVIAAMKRLLDSGVPLNKRIRLILGCQEESGDWLDIQHYLDTEEQPAYGFTPDGDFPAIYGEKGILVAQLTAPLADSGLNAISAGTAVNVVPNRATAIAVDGTVYEGIGVASHGSMPEDGVNAIAKLLEQLVDTSCLAQWYMQKIGYTTDGTQISCGYFDEASGGLTFSVGTATSDDTTITLEVDIRYPVSCQPEEIIANLQREVAELGGTARMVGQKNPVFQDVDSPVIQALLAAYRERTGDNSPPTVIGGGTYARAMDNIVAFGPVFPGHPCTEHMKNEAISLVDLQDAEEIYFDALKNLLEI